jgi:hypothetical protein
MLRRMRRRGWFVGVAMAAGLALAAPPVGAAHWSHFGGDPGRSGAQPVQQSGGAITLLYSKTARADLDVRTSIITTGGPPTAQRLAYGSEDGVIILRTLLSGAPVGPSTGADLGADPFPFGSSGSASFVSSSTEDALGQLYVVHNEVYEGGVIGLELSQIDETSGTRSRPDIALAGTVGYRIQSSPLLTPDDGSGVRHLFFVAEEREATTDRQERLFRVTITNASSPAATIGAAVAGPDVNAHAEASPTLVYLRDAGGTARPFVAVSTTTGLQTVAVSDLSLGPADLTVGEPLRTPSVPVTANGTTPGAPGSGVATAPAIYAASSDGSANTTTLHRFVQNGNSQVLARTSSPKVTGTASPALALTADGTRAVVATSNNLYGFTTSDLALRAKFSVTDDLVATSTGFSRTVPVTTGSEVVIVTDGGRQLVLEDGSLQPVGEDLFVPAASGSGSTASFGQPAISRGYLQLATDKGLFVYHQPLPPSGYWLAASDGGIFTYGDAEFFGSTGDIRLNRPIVGMAATPTRQGYWLAATDGGIFTFGDAVFFGSTGDRTLNSPIVGMVPTRTGLGYWLVAADGGVFSFGDAEFFGSTGDIVLNQPIVGMATTVTGDGYYLVARDGGIFAFGDAEFLGSTGDIRLNSPIVGMARVPAGEGYWLVAADGGVFSFGRRATFFGSTGDIRLNSPIVGMAASATGQGYLFTAADGGVFVFGDAPFLGAAAELGPLNRPVVTVAAKP